MVAGAERRGRRDGNRDEDETSLFQRSERERSEDKEGEKSRTEGAKTGRESERGRETPRRRSTTGRGGRNRAREMGRESFSFSLSVRNGDRILRMAKVAGREREEGGGSGSRCT